MSSCRIPCERVSLDVGTLALCLEGRLASAAKYEYTNKQECTQSKVSQLLETAIKTNLSEI